ncbi:MAG: hypothetical protein AB1724_12130 [Thermodesulfobacteriota bacterium]
MRNLKIIIWVVLLTICLQPVPQVFALKKETHKNINEFIGENTINEFSLDSYLRNQVGFPDGKDEILFSKQAYKWFGRGGEEEDVPISRGANHFHNPLEADIHEAGFSGCLDISLCFSGESSVLWSQRESGEQSPGGHYSWDDVRDKFYLALTAPNKETKDKEFVKTFRGLGQLMHLVEDLTVPEHARDDGHISSAYEVWANGTTNGDSNVDIASITPFMVDKAVLRQTSVFPEASVPVANLFDSNQYSGTNPEITLRSDIGLSEYTNANFVSWDTLFSRQFLYPSRETSVEVKELDYPNPFSPGDTVKRPYYIKIANGDSGYRLAGVDYLSFYMETYYGSDFPTSETKTIPPMDSYVFQDYAEKLIPRAVGYAAALLEFFFRGKMELAADGEGCYIVNPMNEEIQGRFELYYDNVNDERVPVNNVDNYPWQDAVNPSEEDILNMTAAYMCVAAGGQSDPLELFAIPQDAKTPGEFMLVMKGRMGQETINAVAASKITIPLIEISLPEEGYYAFTDTHPYYDPSDPRYPDKYMNNPAGQGFNKIVVNAVSKTDDLTKGTVSLQVKYRRGLEDQFAATPGATTYSTFYQIVAENQIPTAQGEIISSQGPTRLEFNLPAELPLWATDVHLFLVYNGTRGTETNALGLGYKDISEPTPLDFINVMDKICMKNVLHDAGSTDAIEIVDTDLDGIANPWEWDVYSHGIKNLSVRFARNSTWHYDIASVPPGGFSRVFFLGEYGNQPYVWETYSLSKIDIDDGFNHSTAYNKSSYMPGVVNQMVYGNYCSVPCLARRTTPFTTSYRGLASSRGVIFINSPYQSDNNGCDYAD